MCSPSPASPSRAATSTSSRSRSRRARRIQCGTTRLRLPGRNGPAAPVTDRRSPGDKEKTRRRHRKTGAIWVTQTKRLLPPVLLRLLVFWSPAIRGRRFEYTRLTILAHGVPREVPAVHPRVDAGGQGLDERQRAAEVEQSVGAAERVRHHRAREHDRPVVETRGRERPGGAAHRAVPC